MTKVGRAFEEEKQEAVKEAVKVAVKRTKEEDNRKMAKAHC